MLANLYADNYTLGFSQAETTLEQAMAIARKGALLEPQNQYARSNLAYMHFLLNEREMFFREAEQALALNPNAPTLVGFIGWEMVLYGERERGVALMEKGMKLNPYYPGWFHLVPYLNVYQQGRYEEAYQHALKFQAPHIFWDPLLRAAALGQLGREREARAAVDELLTLKPDFHTSGPSLMEIYVKTRSQVDGLLEGLQQAGLGTFSPTRTAI
jgi:adenylate cyclase